MFTKIEMQRAGIFQAVAVCSEEEEEEFEDEGTRFDTVRWQAVCTNGVRFLAWRGGGSIVVPHEWLATDD